MRIAVMNYSGNVGKTTVARDIFKYRLPDYQLIAIETVNSDGKDELCIRGENGEAIFSNVLMTDDVILDIGASNLEHFFNHAIKESTILSLIDRFVIPTTSEQKQQIDTLRTVDELINHQHVDADKIYILLNRYEEDKRIPVESAYSEVFKLAKMVNVHLLSENAIPQSDCYAKKTRLVEMLTHTDYTALMNEQKEISKKHKAEGDQQKADQAHEKAYAYARKHVQQRKLQRINTMYQEICDIIMT